MSICTFFGHKDCPDSVLPKLMVLLEDLILNHCVNQFLVGNQGNFDFYVHTVLEKLSKAYPHINCSVVLAYMPQKQKEFESTNYFNTILPEGIENIPPRVAISWRNKWMIIQAEYVVTYINRSFGGAAQFALLAKRKQKICINIEV